jgi:hypothetical protein
LLAVPFFLGVFLGWVLLARLLARLFFVIHVLSLLLIYYG